MNDWATDSMEDKEVVEKKNKLSLSASVARKVTVSFTNERSRGDGAQCQGMI